MIYRRRYFVYALMGFALVSSGCVVANSQPEALALDVMADGPVEHPVLQVSRSVVECADYDIVIGTTVAAGQFSITELSTNGRAMDAAALAHASERVRSTGEFAYFGVSCRRNSSVSVVFFPYVPPGQVEPEDIYMAQWWHDRNEWLPRG